MKVVESISVVISDDSAGKDMLFGPLPNLNGESNENFTTLNDGIAKIAGAATEDLPLGDVTAVKRVYLIADGDCDIKFNGGTEVFEMRVSDSSTGVVNRKVRLYWPANTDQVNITNSSATDVLTVRFAVWGDPA